jgi:two-component system NtrC family sensor kinase
MTTFIRKIGRGVAAVGRFIVAAPDGGGSLKTYARLRRNMIVLMILVTVVPLGLMALINYYEYQKVLRAQIVTPLKVLLNNTRYSFALFLAERRGAVSFLARAYDYAHLAEQRNLDLVFQVMKREFGGFVDLGLIDASGRQVSYVGPYQLQGKNYRDQAWFQEVSVRGTYISDVFMGFRRYPHFVIAVQHRSAAGQSWIVRATIDIERFQGLIGSMGLEPDSDAFILNREGVFQTPSRFYGHVLQYCPLKLPPAGSEPTVVESIDPRGRPILVGSASMPALPFVLVVVKPQARVWKAWYTLESDLFWLFIGSVVIIFLVVFRLTGIMVRRIEVSEQKERQVLHEIEQTNKLASIGRLAAGVAHEINNPTAIIDQKAGLMKDYLQATPRFDKSEKFMELTESILGAVDRVRTITHRLLGFARRMDVEVTVLDLNEVVQEVLGFLENEAKHRQIDLRLNLAEGLPRIASDHGQLQQAFLNIINNAFAAVEDGGKVTVTSWEKDLDTVAVAIRDNGHGMSEETMKHIFEPFFTTKKGYGTGLGLSITYGIIRRLGGEITVASRPGQGATFTVYLPRKHAEGGGV